METDRRLLVKRLDPGQSRIRYSFWYRSKDKSSTKGFGIKAGFKVSESQDFRRSLYDDSWAEIFERLKPFELDTPLANSQLSQISLKLLQRIHLNRIHSQLGGTFQIERAIVDKAAFLRGNLCRLKG